MKKNILLCLMILFQSCAPTLLVDKADLAKIPKGSTKVVAYSPYSADEAFGIVSKNLAQYGCPVKSNKESMQVICDGKSVEGGTVIKAMAYIEPDGDSSKVTFSGEWGLDAQGQVMMSAFTGVNGVSGSSKIQWDGIAGTKPCIAYQNLILMARTIPNSRVKYSKN
ncbi:hypothetical protein [Dyadobacter sp. Leaf189]|uniref:hypothetical protein n=1 Tax=Dyadobacter sp. Leaf189 TaxID=1736295 RepID=UPI0006F73E49|nr:hypothetical protein [Dyadobacter sp. Leaf189]KQS34018.1 hypothetical protein ASG33_08285 [Dyadobacter sp. Leaf189]